MTKSSELTRTQKDKYNATKRRRRAARANARRRAGQSPQQQRLAEKEKERRRVRDRSESDAARKARRLVDSKRESDRRVQRSAEEHVSFRQRERRLERERYKRRKRARRTNALRTRTLAARATLQRATRRLPLPISQMLARNRAARADVNRHAAELIARRGAEKHASVRSGAPRLHPHMQRYVPGPQHRVLSLLTMPNRVQCAASTASAQVMNASTTARPSVSADTIEDDSDSSSDSFVTRLQQCDTAREAIACLRREYPSKVMTIMQDTRFVEFLEFGSARECVARFRAFNNRKQ